MKLPKEVKMIFLNNNSYLKANNQENLIVTYVKIDAQEEAVITVKDGKVVMIPGNYEREGHKMAKVVIDTTKVVCYEP